MQYHSMALVVVLALSGAVDAAPAGFHLPRNVVRVRQFPEPKLAGGIAIPTGSFSAPTIPSGQSLPGAAGGIPDVFPTSLPSGLPDLPSKRNAQSGFSLPSWLSGLGGTATSSGEENAASSPTAQANSTGGASAAPKSGATCSASSGRSTENGVKDGCCTDLTVVFARGTSEGGNVGTVAGPPMFSSLRTKLNNRVAVQGVDYPASTAVR